MFFEQYNHEPGVAVARFLLHYTDDPALHAERIAERRRAGERALAAMESHLAQSDLPRRQTRSRSPTSRSTRTRMSPTKAGIELTNYPAIGRWLARVAAEPRHIPIDA